MSLDLEAAARYVGGLEGRADLARDSLRRLREGPPEVASTPSEFDIRDAISGLHSGYIVAAKALGDDNATYPADLQEPTACTFVPPDLRPAGAGYHAPVVPRFLVADNAEYLEGVEAVIEAFGRHADDLRQRLAEAGQ